MADFNWLSSLLGGCLIGLSAGMLMLLNGRVAGVSGILAGLLRRPTASMVENAVFILGLLLGPMVYVLVSGSYPEVRLQTSTAVVAIAGLLVGFGTRMGSGCTSGHGVVGLARLSPRSIVAVATFLLSAAIVVFVARHVI